jgi:glycosyltransferase involved in cell wall biosynthesis
MTVHFVEPPPALRIGGLDAAIRSLEAALRDQGISVVSGETREATTGDVVHFHGLWQPAHARRSAELRRRGIVSVVSPHGMLEPWAWRHKWWKKWPYFWLVEAPHLRRATCLLATAPQEERCIRGFLPRQDVRTLPLGFTADAQPDYHAARSRLGWSETETVLLFLSRLHPKKGIDLLFEALASVEIPSDTRFVIVGGGEATYVRSLQALAKAEAAKLPRIDWIGEVWGDERWPYFQGADLFCLTSHSENFGLAVLEACQVGTPVLTTTTTPWGEWLSRDSAFIAEPKVASIAEKLRHFFAQAKAGDEQRTAFATAVRGDFSWEVLGPRYAALYRELASKAL